MLEEVRAKLKVVAEGHGGLTKEIQQTRASLETRIDDLEQAMFKGFDRVWGAVNQVDSNLAQMSVRFDAHEQTHTQ